MTKKEYCMKNHAVAYASTLGGVEINGVEYGIDDYIYATSGAWTGSNKKYHHVKINYTTSRSCRSFIIIQGQRIYLDECLRIN